MTRVRRVSTIAKLIVFGFWESLYALRRAEARFSRRVDPWFERYIYVIFGFAVAFSVALSMGSFLGGLFLIECLALLIVTRLGARHPLLRNIAKPPIVILVMATSVPLVFETVLRWFRHPLIGDAIAIYETSVYHLHAYSLVVKGIGWEWWMLLAAALLWLGIRLESEILLERAVVAREALSAGVLFLAFASSLSLTTDVPSSSFEPDLGHAILVKIEEIKAQQLSISAEEDVEKELAERRDWHALAYRLSEVDRYYNGPPEATATPEDPRTKRAMEIAKDFVAHNQILLDRLDEDLSERRTAILDYARTVGADAMIHALQPLPTDSKIVSTSSTAEKIDALHVLTSAEARSKVLADQARKAFSLAIGDAFEYSPVRAPIVEDFIGELVSSASKKAAEQLLDRVPLDRWIDHGRVQLGRLTQLTEPYARLFTRKLVSSFEVEPPQMSAGDLRTAIAKEFKEKVVDAVETRLKAAREGAKLREFAEHR